MLLLGQKSCISGPTIFKIPQPNCHYYRYYLEKLEDNSTKYQETKTVEASEQVRVLALQAKLEAKKPSQL